MDKINRFEQIKSIVKPNYVILIASLAAWIAIVILIMFPTIGTTTTVYPQNPTPNYLLIGLIGTAGVAASYSFVLGIRLFRENVRSRFLNEYIERVLLKKKQNSTDTNTPNSANI